jgi:oligopeptide/dipeptide ABC transporter ATP-binding protein
LAVKRGGVTALVGESGCGKSVTAYAVLRLVQKPGRIVSGKMMVFPKNRPAIDIFSLDEKDEALYDIRGGLISMIFQEPMSALSPVHKVGDQIIEAILLHDGKKGSKKERLARATEKAVDMLQKVGIPGAASKMSLYPHELSGGMRQRIVTAMAAVCNPELLIADEPTTALDVTIQAQVIDLMKRMQKDMGTSVLLITHDFGVVSKLADVVVVMYLGRAVEQAPVRELMRTPFHPYTAALIRSLPSLHRGKERLPAIEGNVPSPAHVPPGCPFHPRCQHAVAGRCDIGDPPPIIELEPGHEVACLRASELRGKA